MGLNIKQILRGSSWVPTLYLAEGIPYVVVMTVAVILFKRMGVPNGPLAYYTSLLGLPWVIKPLWSPFVEMFGTRRIWVVAMQLLVALGFACVAFSLPGHDWLRLSMASFMFVGFMSATHDIAADGFYMLGLNEEGQSFFVGIRTMFYRLAMLLGQGPLVILAGYLEVTYGDIPRAWATTFYILAVVMAIMSLYHAFVLPRPAADRHAQVRSVEAVAREFWSTVVGFFTREHSVYAILFMLFYKFPEALLAKMISPFLLDGTTVGGLGLSTTAVGIAYGTLGLIGLILGGVIGGIVAASFGLRKCLMPMAWSMSATCIGFVILAFLPSPSFLTVNVCVFIEQFGYGFGTTAYILYLIHYSRGPRSTAYYAFATGIMSIGLMLPGMVAGKMQEFLGYGNFFIMTMICCALTIAVSAAVKNKIDR
ncbi:MAG: MFS transporter [Bacteroides sp.]|nr:MFS transporter [Bacteroides sp.]MCM1413658.1 MFS transporter [Bacteroides sp.]MCM1471837.1 MFS transporter [Bacteroides sp.]